VLASESFYELKIPPRTPQANTASPLLGWLHYPRIV
jgi:hypothetical protein